MDSIEFPQGCKHDTAAATRSRGRPPHSRHSFHFESPVRKEKAGAGRKQAPRAEAPAASYAERRAPPGPLAPLGEALRGKLAKLGLRRGSDLVVHLPLRYDDETHLYAIRDAPHGRHVLVEGAVTETAIKYRPRRQLIVTVEDAGGVVMARFLNFYMSQVKQLAVGTRVRLFGEIRQGFFGAEMVHPRYRIVRDGTPVPETLTPVYPATAGVAQHVLRKLIDEALRAEPLDDTLPAELLAHLELPPFGEAVRYLHHPPPDASQAALENRTHPAWRRMKFDELLAQQLSMRRHHERRSRVRAPALKAGGALTRALLDTLPFRLTRAQARAWREIERDVAQPHPMQRLLQGDVGSGKTIVAALACLRAIESGRQAAVMAPTELLTSQHYAKFAAWLEPLGVRVVWLTGTAPAKDKRAALAAVAEGDAQVAVGTHALFQDKVEFAKLGLAVIDEQHRFGVHQRLALRAKGGAGNVQPHQLMMSATPIPRTLAMSYYADLDVSVIDELPPGRTPVATRLVSNARRAEVIQRVRDACLAGTQAYWVCPLIEESEALQLETALETCQHLQQTFPELQVGLVHGRLAPAEKLAVMQAFQAGRIQLLVATTVIEVGVDVPNAGLMVIESAERMGLAQLHQLRGRVGRGAAASTCILLYQNPLAQTARERLKIIFENADGFEVARHDLRLRGPGELLGARQSGLPMLRFADLETDLDLLDAARTAAADLLGGDASARACADRHLERWLGSREELLRV
jgi:ATP-dependent DNA helicase RecG